MFYAKSTAKVNYIREKEKCIPTSKIVIHYLKRHSTVEDFEKCGENEVE